MIFDRTTPVIGIVRRLRKLKKMNSFRNLITDASLFIHFRYFPRCSPVLL